MSTGEAVRAVRFGLRAEFWRAIEPVMPRKRAAGRPKNSETGREITGPRMMVPMNTARMPTPRRTVSAPAMTAATTAMPMPIVMNPATVRLRPVSMISIAVLRIAANGGTLPARRAGNHADATVTSTPTISVSIMVLGLITRPPLGISMLNARSKALRPFDNPIPPTRPSRDPKMPTTTDSINMARVTCLRLAPMARSNAFSR